jgi:hypothetical protein
MSHTPEATPFMSYEQAILLRDWEATLTERSDTPFTKTQGLGKVRECLFHGLLMSVGRCRTRWE